MPPLSATSLTIAPSATTELGRVFLVEDEDYIADLMEVIFTGAGLVVVRARDGAEALRLATETPGAIALALVDLGLPDIAGEELCRRLRMLQPGVPVLLTSGREMETLQRELESGGPTGLLPKPYRPAELLRQVRALLPAAA
jgi:DNA-binding response OmpR family regulator